MCQRQAVRVHEQHAHRGSFGTGTGLHQRGANQPKEAAPEKSSSSG